VKVLCILFLLVTLTGCTVEGTATEPTVSPASFSEFLEIVKSEDFHKMARKGKAVFEQNHYIPNHANLFAEYPSSEIDQGRIRYDLYGFEGEASAGMVYLILEQDSGKVIEFNYLEAWFE